MCVKNGCGDKWYFKEYEKPFFELEDKFDFKNMAYIAPNGKEILKKVDKSMTYVISGVHHSYYHDNPKNLLRFEKMDIPTFRLPMERYV